MNITLTGRVALVTGSARGIGLEIATGLAETGAHVVLSDIDPAGAARARELVAAGHAASWIEMDTADEESVGTAVAELAATVVAVQPHDIALRRRVGLIEDRQDPDNGIVEFLEVIGQILAFSILLGVIGGLPLRGAGDDLAQ